MISVSERLQRIPPYAMATIAKRVRGLAAQGHDIIRIDMGSPDMPPAPQVIEALENSAERPNHHGYAGYVGIPPLRQAFADYFARRFEVELDPDTEVLPLLGSKEGLVNLQIALVDPGDVVLFPDPGYPIYESGALLAGATPYAVPLDPAQNFLPDLLSVPPDVLENAKLLWINYPNNPTGAVASLEELAGIVAFCREHDILLASDNPYADVTFDGHRAPSILQVEGAKDLAVEFVSMSKTYNMAGWRVGACVGNEQMVQALLRVKSNIDSGLFRAIQDAATVALNEVGNDWIGQRNAIYQQRRDIIMETLPHIGLSGEPPKASLYVWAKVDSGDDVDYAKRALEEAHVSMAPGSVYGEHGAGYVRMSLIAREERMHEAMQRLKDWYAGS